MAGRKILFATTEDEKEVLKACMASGKLKDLLQVADFEVQEIIAYIAETEGDEDRTMVSIKVDGKYYKGIAQKVVQSAHVLAEWINSQRLMSANYEEPVCRLVKATGRYASMDLELC